VRIDNIHPEPGIIELKGICTTYEGERSPAIFDIDVGIVGGEFVCVLGPNGAGKTTLLETVNGILRYVSGSGKVFGKEISGNLGHIRTRTGYVVQNFDIDPLAPFLCKDIVMSGRTGKIGLLRFAGKDDWTLVSSAVEKVGMSEFWSRPVGKLSGGEFQKILLARAVAQQPELLLLDEPFSHLDFESKGQMQALVTDMNRKEGVTVLMVSHHITTVPEACSRILVMQKGRITMDGGREEVLGSETMTQIFANGGCGP
jgi:zinc/manganese transport system ATP-binding protein